MPVCITFDTERDWYNSRSTKKLGYDNKGKYFSMLERAIPKLLEIGDEYDIPYTFFICGEVAENCKSLFSNLGRHCIGVHTHPFTHIGIFKGISPNDYRQDLLGEYTRDEQYQMISRDLQLVVDNLRIKPKVFRAGKYNTNHDTFEVLGKLGFEVDCSMNPTFQIIGWQPYKIPGTSVWEIPTYCDFSPEIASYIRALLKVSAVAHSFTHGFYLGTIHPMIFGNPMINTRDYFDRYKVMIESMLECGFDFLTVEQVLGQAYRINRAYNTVGKIISSIASPVNWLIRKII